ncbi:c-type cytochrome [Amaricoccus solimangrovi]|uniref:C-type cytochrome n=1 Tax=Amaricoccus solimangrovi TaxID=2589815 RepID=A0A501WQB4_9RHOB|nr:c-type cytochrome [Amaricoccus solimangrovi]TPE51659.1 c-type cytochrome [Amaricoccus solimangrovi]
MRIRARHLLYALLVAPPAALLLAWLGVIGVGAASGHWAVTDWFLHFTMRSSVRTAALLDPVPAPPDDALRPAAGHYDRGCAPCHGAPGKPRPPQVLGMLPKPPDLVGRVGSWSDAELHRIVMHGVRFTGMPAWPAQARDDEGLMMVAFLRALPDLSPEDYAGLVTAPEGTLPAGCSGCHGPEGRGGGPRVPRLAGQSETYLRQSLAAYAQGGRESGIMAQAVNGVPSETLAEIARHVARLPATDGGADPAPATPAPAIARVGRPEHGVPACLSCHGEPRKNPSVPRLGGQPAAYLAAQLRLFRDGERGGGPYANVMARAAAGLEDEEIDMLAAWFSQAPPEPAKP